MAERKASNLLRSVQTGGAVFALFVLAILSLFLVKVPTWLLDLLLVANLFLALTLLLRSVFTERRTPFHTFPTVLVLATLFRLALNVSSTKLILLQGDEGLDAAGRVIEAFGTFVVRGDFIVGFILFGIIATVNFVVIAKGSARVAEVAARFSLDALPGRQLSIDSDLRNGNINAAEAKEQRLALDRESQFFGAMDGAMKWVQGDAIAGFVITGINLVGGVAIGLSRGMNFSDAVNTFGILTIGDGLLSILPSLLISVAAGIVVTSTSGSESEDSAQQLIRQFGADPRAPLLAALALVVVGSLGMLGLADFPAIPFFALGFAIFGFFYLYEQRGTALQLQDATIEGNWPLALPEELPATRGHVQPLRIELDGNGLGPLLRTPSSPLSRAFWEFAETQATSYLQEFGLALPRPILSSTTTLAEGEYRILVRDRVVRRGLVRAGSFFVDTHESLPRMYGAEVIEVVPHPITQRTSVWIRSNPGIERALRRLRVSLLGPAEYIWLDAVGALLESIDDILGLAEVHQLIDHAEPSVRRLVDELIAADTVGMPEVAEVFRRLARERVSIRDVKRIVEGVAEFAVLEPRDSNRRADWLVELHSYLRLLLTRSIVQQCVGPSGRMRTFLLSKEVESELSSAVSLWDRMRTPPPLDPIFAQELRESAKRLFNPVIERGALPVVLVCNNEVRLAAHEFFSRLYDSSDWLRTVTYEEIASARDVELVSIVHAHV